MAKRANGEGTIRKRSDGRWEGRYYDPVADKQRSVYGNTQKEIREKLTKIASQKDMGKFVSKQNITLDEWFDIYIATYKEGNIKPQSLNSLKTQYRLYIQKGIGDMKIQDIKELDVRRLVTGLQKEGLSDNVIRNALSRIREVFNFALKNNLLTTNPAEDISVNNASSKKYEKRELTQFELYWFFRGLKEVSPTDSLFFEMLYGTGARRGEIQAIKWSDVSKDYSILSINSTYVEYTDDETGNRIREVGTTKTKASKREIPLSERIQIKLKKHKEKAKFLAQQFDIPFDDSLYVFFNYGDKRLPYRNYYPNLMRKIFHYLSKEYNIKLDNFSTHYFRHTFVSRATKKGIPIETIKKIVGHSNYQMIFNTYTHCSQDDKIDAINKLASEDVIIDKVDYQSSQALLFTIANNEI